MVGKSQLSGFLEAVLDGYANAAAWRLAAQLRFCFPLDPGPVEGRHLSLDVVVDCPYNLLRLFVHSLAPSFTSGHYLCPNYSDCQTVGNAVRSCPISSPPFRPRSHLAPSQNRERTPYLPVRSVLSADGLVLWKRPCPPRMLARRLNISSCIEHRLG
jgi:hypothetical protein